MRKSVLIIISILCVLLVVTGCSTTSSKAVTYTVDNGDKIKIKLNTADNYDLSSELPFTISCNGETLSQGTFIQGEAYAQYISAVEGDGNAELLDSGTKDGNEYIFWSYNGSEYNYAILISDSNTGIILGNVVSEASARECFSRLTVAVSD